jgi:hypothetical protein
MVELMRPVERMWEWVERTGGYPGKMMFVSLMVMAVVGAVTWYTNRH